MSRLAILSVSDRTNLERFARGLVELGFEILSTGGTGKFLEAKGLPVIPVSAYTGQPEILHGRLKTLHPKILGGILAHRDVPEDMRELERAGIVPIELVAVNLYPFASKVAEVESSGMVPHPPLIESIDIGGPTMIRAAAKNCRFVVPVSDPMDYDAVLDELNSAPGVSVETRRRLACKVFTMMSAYDGAIARYFSLGEELLSPEGKPKLLAPVETFVLKQVDRLRYGENPHQCAALYRVAGRHEYASPDWKQLQGKELSYNNILDMQAALDLFFDVCAVAGERHTAVIIKHANPCGVAIRDTAIKAYLAARECDPVSAFGGIVVVSGPLHAALAETILEGFVEVVLAESVTSDAMEVFQRKKNVRVLEFDRERLKRCRDMGWVSIRNAFGDYLVQTSDHTLSPLREARLAAGSAPTNASLDDLKLAWAVCKHVKSNAIVIARDLKVIGVGAGQMNRVDSARFAIQRAEAHGAVVRGGVAASDAFLPFPDTLEVLADGGITALVQPGGSIRDEEVIQAAVNRGITLLLTGERHFRH